MWGASRFLGGETLREILRENERKKKKQLRWKERREKEMRNDSSVRIFLGGKFFMVTPLLLYWFLSFATFVIYCMLGYGYWRPTCCLLISGMNIRDSYIHLGWFLGLLFVSSLVSLIPFMHNLILPLVRCVAWWALFYSLFLP